MATFTRIPRAELERMARAQYERAFPKGRVQASPPRNIRATLASLGADRIAISYRGRLWELLSVGFEDGLRLTEARFAVEAMEGTDVTPEKARDYHRAIKSVVGLAPKYLRPVGRVRRFFWRLGIRPNPYRGATDAEVGQLLGFFSACQMRSRVRFLAT